MNQKAGGLIHRLKRQHFHKKAHSIFGFLISGVLVASLIFAGLLQSELARAATFTLTQSNWGGGLDGGTYPVHPTNQTNWTKYASKDSFITAASGGVSITTSTTPTVSQTSDTDFALGTHSTTETTGSGSSASVRLASISTGLVAQWPFGEGTGTTTADATGNGNTGTLNTFAAPPTAISGWTSGKIGNGLIFDGDSDYITVTQNSGLPVYSKTNPYSVAFWVKGTSPPLFGYIYSEQNNATSSQGFAIRAGATATKIAVLLSDDAGTVKINQTQSTATVFDGTWHHIVFTDSAGTAKLYVDGSQDASNYNYTPGAGTYTFNRVAIGALLRGSAANYFIGSIDDVRVYSRALSSTDVTTLYNFGSGTGTFTSGVIDTAASSTFTTLSYNVTTPANTGITIDVRAGDVASPDGTWTAWQASIASGGSIAALGTKRYIQYRANLSTTSDSATPTLDDITISYLHSPASLISSAYNSADSSNVMASVSWSAATSSETLVKFQIRTAPNSAGSPGTFTSWMGPDGTSATYFTDPAGGETMPSAVRDGLNDQWFQYKAILTTTDSTLTATLTSVSIRYVVNASPEFDADYPTAAAGGVVGVQNSDGTVSISYSVRDVDTSTGSITPGYITPSFEYSTNNGSSWAAISGGALGATATTNKTVDQSTYTNYTATWYATSTIPSVYNATVKVRVTANDNEGANNTASATSAAFTVDTTAPTIGTYTLNVGVNTISLAVSENSNISYRLSNNADLSADGLNATSGQWQAVGATSVTSTISWVFPTMTNPTVYLETKDPFSNQTNRTGVAPQAPQNFQLEDVSTPSSNDFKEFIYWDLNTPATGATFASYKVHRSTDDGSTYSNISTIADINFNYFLDPNVSSSTTYTYRVQTADSDGDTSGFTTALPDLPNGQGGTDITVPILSSVSVSVTQSTWATIIWTTDELSNSVVEYSADPDTGFGTTKTISTMVTSHSATVTGLTPNTLYHYRLRSTDISGNAGTNDNGGGGFSFTTAGGPVISNVTTPSISDRAATISWDTNIDANSIVKYSDNIALTSLQQAGSVSLTGLASSSPVFPHSVNLTGLSSGRTYYYYVESTDANSNLTSDNNGGAYYTFNTTQDQTGPVISNISTPVVAATTAVIVWQTDELATSQVVYGTASTSLSSQSTLDSTLSIYHIVTLTGLTEQTNYFFAPKSKDAADNLTTATTQSLTTTEDQTVLIAALTAAGAGGYSGATEGDVTPPVITNVIVQNLGAVSATIAWHVNESARSFVELTDSNGKKVTFGLADPSQDPKVLMSGLRLGESYSFIARSIDLAGNITSSALAQFKTKFAAEPGEDLTEITDISDLQKKLSDIIESALPSLRPPTISDIAVNGITETEATVTWKTNIKGTSLVALAPKSQYHEDAAKPYPTELSGQDDSVKEHSLLLGSLTPNTTYHYQVRSKTLVGTLGKGPDKTFTTKAGKLKPVISGVTNTSFIVSWTTDAPASSVVEYKNLATGAVNKKEDAAPVTRHEMLVENLPQGGSYDVSVSGVNAEGNTLSGESAKITIKRDVSAPQISNFHVESFVVPGRTDRIQTVVTWQTDEPATSMVEYGEGSIQNTKDLELRYEDAKSLTLGHTVALLNLKPQTVYTMLVTSKDEFGNKATLGPRTAITPQQAQSIIDVIFGNFNDTFKFVKNINQ